MSSHNNGGFNQTSSTGRNEGFSDSRGGVESYGQGTGSGAFDPANTGLGGYGGQNQPQQRASEDQTFRTSSNFDNSPDRSQGQGQTEGSQRAFGGDRSSEKPGFTGSESTYYDKTATGGAFAQRSASGVGQTDEFGSGNTSSISGTRASGASSGSRFGNATDDDRDNEQWGTSRGDQSFRNDQFGGERQTGKPTFGDKMRGNVEKLAGTVTGKQDLKERGQERKTGDF